MGIVTNLKPIFGDPDIVESIKSEIISIFDKDHEEKGHITKLVHDTEHVLCKIETLNFKYNQEITINLESDHYYPIINSESVVNKQPNYLLIIGNGFSRRLVRENQSTEEKVDIFDTKYLCEKSLSKLNNLMTFFEKVDQHNPGLDFEDKIGLLFDLIQFAPELKNQNSLVKEYKQFINDVLEYIFNCSRRINLQDFEPEFCEFLQSKTPHIATLNYDQIIYTFLFKPKEANVLSKSKDIYTDGFCPFTNEALVFNPKMIREYLKKKKFYLHLHGSCLFHKDSITNKIQKKQYSSLYNSYEMDPLVVLTSGVKKYSTVHNDFDFSYILHAYNRMLEWTIKRCEKLIILGYGVKDLYLNEVIAQGILINKKVEIHFIETHVASQQRNFDRLLDFIKKSPIEAKQSQIISSRINFHYSDEVNLWNNL